MKTALRQHPTRPIDSDAATNPQPELSAVMLALPDDPITSSRVLQRLEVLRQQVSVRWCGTEGAFAGYDELAVCQSHSLMSGFVRLSARITASGEGTHTVELLATHSASDEHALGATSEILVKGCGRALEVELSRC